MECFVMGHLHPGTVPTHTTFLQYGLKPCQSSPHPQDSTRSKPGHNNGGIPDTVPHQRAKKKRARERERGDGYVLIRHSHPFLQTHRIGNQALLQRINHSVQLPDDRPTKQPPTNIPPHRPPLSKPLWNNSTRGPQNGKRSSPQFRSKSRTETTSSMKRPYLLRSGHVR
jgi:hypothetical protein